jgi:hypothetical protein
MERVIQLSCLPSPIAVVRLDRSASRIGQAGLVPTEHTDEGRPGSLFPREITVTRHRRTSSSASRKPTPVYLSCRQQELSCTVGQIRMRLFFPGHCRFRPLPPSFPRSGSRPPILGAWLFLCHAEGESSFVDRPISRHALEKREKKVFCQVHECPGDTRGVTTMV